MRARLVLVRHGETVWHAENRYAGAASDIDLTERGRHQAELLAGWAATARLAAVVVSPVRRAVETARPTLTRLGLDPEIEDDLREVGFGVAEGRTLEELATADPELVARFRRDPAAHPFPGAEAPGDAARRGAAALRHAAARHVGGTVLVVAHNTVLRLALCSLLGVPVADYRRVLPRLDNVALTTLEVAPTGPASLLGLNVPLRRVAPAWAMMGL